MQLPLPQSVMGEICGQHSCLAGEWLDTAVKWRLVGTSLDALSKSLSEILVADASLPTPGGTCATPQVWYGAGVRQRAASGCHPTDIRVGTVIGVAGDSRKSSGHAWRSALPLLEPFYR